MPMPEHLTPKMIQALEYLASESDPARAHAVHIGRACEIRYTRGSYMGQVKVFGVGSAGAAIARALVRRGLATEELHQYMDELTIYWKITEAGRQKLSALSETMPA